MLKTVQLHGWSSDDQMHWLSRFLLPYGWAFCFHRLATFCGSCDWAPQQPNPQVKPAGRNRVLDCLHLMSSSLYISEAVETVTSQRKLYECNWNGCGCQNPTASLKIPNVFDHEYKQFINAIAGSQLHTTCWHVSALSTSPRLNSLLVLRSSEINNWYQSRPPTWALKSRVAQSLRKGNMAVGAN